MDKITDESHERYEALDLRTAALSREVIGAAIEVHRHLGPGQCESTYERALAIELAARAVPFRSQVPIIVRYKQEVVGEFAADLLIDDRLIVELKSIDHLGDVQRGQLLSYLRASKLRLGLVINFNVTLLKHGIMRVIA